MAYSKPKLRESIKDRIQRLSPRRPRGTVDLPVGKLTPQCLNVGVR